jgi:hypothetical protein
LVAAEAGVKLKNTRMLANKLKTALNAVTFFSDRRFAGRRLEFILDLIF